MYQKIPFEGNSLLHFNFPTIGKEDKYLGSNKLHRVNDWKVVKMSSVLFISQENVGYEAYFFVQAFITASIAGSKFLSLFP